MTGLVRRVNLWPDPLFKTLKPSNKYGGTIERGTNEAVWRATEESNGCGWDFANLEKNTDMVFRCFLWVSATNAIALRVYGYGQSGIQLASFTPNSSRNTPVLRFNTGAYEKIRIEFSAVNGGNTNIGEPNLELAYTFDESLPYFDYSMMPDPRGGGGIRPSLLAARAVRSFWGLAA